ncbi:DinB family protein [Roseateles sp. NT4]|uniref:DinB family protein n=1 Tax=Roseateles sp. NT4 TaxID=3453715 RepID=UPI003EE90E6F
MDALLTTLFEQKASINRELFAEMAKVDAQLHPERRHLAIRILNHIHVVDQIFAGHLRGEPHGFTGTNTEATPTLDVLRTAVERVDAGYVDLVRSLKPEQLAEVLDFRFTDGDAGRMSRAEMLAHVITHGAYHRGGVGMLMRQADVPPPRDLLTRYLHTHEPERRTA